jgi:hypothetical protein
MDRRRTRASTFRSMERTDRRRLMSGRLIVGSGAAAGPVVSMMARD